MSSTATNTLNEKDAIQWFEKNEWKNGLALNPHTSVNKLTFADQYHKNKAAWDKSFAFLKDNNLATMEPGKYEIDGDNAYAIVTENPSKTPEMAKWEAHLRYIDIQYVIKGEEKIGVVPASASTVTKPYDEENDYANFDAEGPLFTAKPGTFFLFFPDDVHRPNILIEGFEVVKKVVIKVKVA